MKKYHVAVVGVGVVGIEILKCLKSRSFPIANLRVFARSARAIEVEGIEYEVEAIGDERFDGVEIALFAGTEGEKGASKLYAHKFIEKGAIVVDNGADFRLEHDVPLVVPEANRDAVKNHKGLIANPNCTTIQAIVALCGIHREFGLERILLTSFQATSGAGKKAAMKLWEEARTLVNINRNKEFDEIHKDVDSEFDVFSHQIAFNVIPQIGGFAEDGYTSEEWKVVNETHKILNDDSIRISSTCVRVPVFTAHSEAIYFETKKDADHAQIEKVLKDSEGVKYFADSSFPLPLEVEGTDLTYVARLRRDPFNKNCFWIWVVADNLRKGAALNAVQIAEELTK
ncbi:MAG: aspartate-semialdehyde dehydrogenase [Candidatus Omnitrophica bacterium]|nr:aspartate-semialdehyde dehydrogenase [Candidatus Omnitrophota bacterium]